MPGPIDDLMKDLTKVVELVDAELGAAEKAVTKAVTRTVVCGSDHAGTELKLILIEHLTNKGFKCTDVGNYNPNDRDDDYPVYGEKVGRAVAAGEAGQQGSGDPRLRLLGAVHRENVPRSQRLQRALHGRKGRRTRARENDRG